MSRPSNLRSSRLSSSINLLDCMQSERAECRLVMCLGFKPWLARTTMTRMNAWLTVELKTISHFAIFLHSMSQMNSHFSLCRF